MIAPRLPRPKIATVPTAALLTFLTHSAFAGVGSWSPLGPYTTHLEHLAIDPAHPSHVVAAGRGASDVYRLTDDGSWVAADLGADTVRSLAAAPGLFLMTTHVIHNDPSEFILRSTDGGASWTEAPELTGLGGFEVVGSTGDAVYLIAGDQVLRSDDAGDSWTFLDDSPTTGERREITAFAVDPGDPSRLFLAVRDDEADRVTLFRSSDAGESWAEASQGLPREFSAGAFSIAALAVDAAAPGTVWAVIRDAGLYRSTDGGESWRPVAGPPAAFFDEVDYTIAHTAARPGTLYVAAANEGGILRTTDGGATWTLLDLDPAFLTARDLVIDPTAPDTIYAATVLGILRSTDGGESWATFNHGLRPSVTPGLAVDPRHPERLFTVVSNLGILRSDDGGVTWELASTAGQTPFPINLQRVAVAPGDSDVVHAVGDHDLDGVYTSTDGGRTFVQSLTVPRFQEIRGLAIDPASPRTVYVSSGSGVFKSTDRGATWTFLDGGLTDTRVLVIDPTTGDLYAAGDGVHRSTNGGRRWFSIGNDLPEDRMQGLAVDPTDPDVLYAGTARSGLYRSDDLGASWAAMALPSNHAGVYDVAVDPDDPAIVYAATGRGVFRTANHGATWRPLARASLDEPVFDLELSADLPRRVYAATFAGIHEIEVVPDPVVLDLQGGRFEVAVKWRDFANQRGRGTVAAVTSAAPGPVSLASRDSAVVEFFSPRNWEMLVKVLDGTAINGHHWVYLAAATNVSYITTVTDTSCGDVKSYHNPLGVVAPAVTDETAFAGCENPGPASCVAGDGVLCLGKDDRFQVEIRWAEFLGDSGIARQVSVPGPGLARSTDSGLFYFFSENNWELLVKVLDGCANNDRFWVFSAATTDVAYTLTVTDTATGAVRVYSNPLGVPAATITDANAFATCGK